MNRLIVESLDFLLWTIIEVAATFDFEALFQALLFTIRTFKGMKFHGDRGAK